MWVGEGGGVSRDPYLPKRTSCLYYSPNIVRVIRTRRMRWVGHGEGRGVYRVLVGTPKDVGGRIT